MIWDVLSKIYHLSDSMQMDGVAAALVREPRVDGEGGTSRSTNKSIDTRRDGNSKHIVRQRGSGIEKMKIKVSNRKCQHILCQ